MSTMAETSDMLFKQPNELDPLIDSKSLYRRLPENFKYYRPWGYTIYRTYYGSETDKHWETLLYSLKAQTNLALGFYDRRDNPEELDRFEGTRLFWPVVFKDEGELQEEVSRIRRLFQLETREDVSCLDGTNIHQLRELCLGELLTMEKTMVGHEFNIVLVADKAVFDDIARGESIVKVVKFDWTDVDDDWGWMKIASGYLLELWHTLMCCQVFDDFYMLSFSGPESELEDHIWYGALAQSPTSRCTEVREHPHHPTQEGMT
ncbi:hypothetical protein ACHAPU_000799 [Fusarium lateritium]